MVEAQMERKIGKPQGKDQPVGDAARHGPDAGDNSGQRCNGRK